MGDPLVTRDYRCIKCVHREIAARNLIHVSSQTLDSLSRLPKALITAWVIPRCERLPTRSAENITALYFQRQKTVCSQLERWDLRQWIEIKDVPYCFTSPFTQSLLSRARMLNHLLKNSFINKIKDTKIFKARLK